MKKLLAKCLAPLILALVLIGLCPAVFAATASAESGLSIIGALVNINIAPGETYIHEMTITNSAGDPLEITVEARGFGQNTDGSNIELTAEADSSPYSARQYITHIDNPSFHLESGASAVVNATIQVPSDISSGTRYAIIYIHSLPTGGGSVGYIVAADVPVILTVPGATLQTTGEITDLTVPEPESGQPLKILTAFKNTGNYHYKIKNQVIIANESVANISTSTTAITASSILPTFSRLFSVTPILPDPAAGLAPGTYTAESKILLDDNTVLATRIISFTILPGYQRIPGLCMDSIVVTNFHDEEPYIIDALVQADTKVELIGTGRVTGTVIIGKYCELPEVSVAFHDSIAAGGTGKDAVKYVYVHTDGISQGTARITVRFTNAEVVDFDVNSLFLGYFDGSMWRKFSNMEVYSGAGTIVGDIPVSALSGTVIGLGGDTGDGKSHEGSNATATPAPATSQPQGPNWPMIGGIIAGALILSLAIFLSARGRKPVAVRERNGRQNRRPPQDDDDDEWRS
ncbi:MAG: hypothetical protein WC455_06975 [Dehalococcoidia bacterium]|jgi:hypothetical protein